MDASGAMATGTIIANGLVYNLNADGTWDGKSGTSATYVSTKTTSSSKRPSSSTQKPEKEPTVDPGFKLSNGTLTITKGSSTPYTAKKVGTDKVTNLIIAESVGDGDVTIEGITVAETTTISGGGSETVRFKNCILNNIVAEKNVTGQGNKRKALHIAFEGEKTQVKGKVKANGGETGSIIRISIENEKISLPAVIAAVPIKIDGAGSIENFTVTVPVMVVLAVSKVEKIFVQENVSPQITLDSSNGMTKAPAPQVVTENGVETEEAAENVVVAVTNSKNPDAVSNITVEGYYDVILNAAEGYWEIIDPATNLKVEDENKNKKIKIANGKNIASVVGAEGFSNPVREGYILGGWKNSEGNIIDLTTVKETMTLVANWVQAPVAVASAEITRESGKTGLVEVGETLTAKPNNNATGKITYQWMSSTDGKTYKNIDGGNSATYTVKDADSGKYIKVKISSDNPESFRESTPVQVVTLVTSAKISGTAEVGQSLKAKANDGATDPTYQWQRSDSENTGYENIKDATNETYTLTDEDAGKYIKVIITGKSGSKAEDHVKVADKETPKPAELTVKSFAATVSGTSATVSIDSTNKKKVTLTVSGGAIGATSATAEVKVTPTSIVMNDGTKDIAGTINDISLAAGGTGKEVSVKVEGYDDVTITLVVNIEIKK